MKYRVVPVGFNGPANNRLRFAEKDALDFSRLMCGALGPVGEEDVTFLRGPYATTRRLADVLSFLVSESPEVVLLFFSGHGSSQGLGLADGIFRHEWLRAALRAINPHVSLVVLDTCDAASYFQKRAAAVLGAALTPDWQTLLAHATPGTRVMAATHVNQKAREYADRGNGAFTWHLLRAPEFAAGDLDGGRFLSDLAAFEAVETWMQASGALHSPQGFRLGGFPLARSQVYQTIGGAALTGVRWRQREVVVDFEMAGRKYVDTEIALRVENALGQLIDERRVTFSPSEESGTYSTTLPLPVLSIIQDPVTRLLRARGQDAGIAWHIQILDDWDRPLDRTQFGLRQAG